MLEVKTPEEVLRLIDREFRTLDRAETVPLSRALGRVLAEDVLAEEYPTQIRPLRFRPHYPLG